MQNFELVFELLKKGGREKKRHKEEKRNWQLKKRNRPVACLIKPEIVVITFFWLICVTKLEPGMQFSDL